MTGPYAAATSPTMWRSVALGQADEAAHRTARPATDGASLCDCCLWCPRLATWTPDDLRRGFTVVSPGSCVLRAAICSTALPPCFVVAAAHDPWDAAAIARELGTFDHEDAHETETHEEQGHHGDVPNPVSEAVCARWRVARSVHSYKLLPNVARCLTRRIDRGDVWSRRQDSPRQPFIRLPDRKLQVQPRHCGARGVAALDATWRDQGLGHPQNWGDFSVGLQTGAEGSGDELPLTYKCSVPDPGR